MLDFYSALDLGYGLGMTGEDSTRRRATRDSVMLHAAVRHEHIGEFSARVRNISSGGIKIDCPSALPGGTPVEVTLRGVGLVHGTVAWSAGGHVGIRFDREIDPKLTMPQISVRKEDEVRRTQIDYRRPGLRISDD